MDASSKKFAGGGGGVLYLCPLVMVTKLRLITRVTEAPHLY